VDRRRDGRKPVKILSLIIGVYCSRPEPSEKYYRPKQWYAYSNSNPISHRAKFSFTYKVFLAPPLPFPCVFLWILRRGNTLGHKWEVWERRSRASYGTVTSANSAFISWRYAVEICHMSTKYRYRNTNDIKNATASKLKAMSATVNAVAPEPIKAFHPNLTYCKYLL